MRPRPAIATTATALGLILLSRFKTPDATRTVAGKPGTVQSSRAASGDGHPATLPTATQSSPATEPSDAAQSGRYKNGAYTGRNVYTRFGYVQLKVIIDGGRIGDVQELQMPYSHRRSLYISQQAGPVLHDEVLQAQSAQIDTLSGATYTSEAYAISVQAALDKAAN